MWCETLIESNENEADVNGNSLIRRVFRRTFSVYFLNRKLWTFTYVRKTGFKFRFYLFIFYLFNFFIFLRHASPLNESRFSAASGQKQIDWKISWASTTWKGIESHLYFEGESPNTHIRFTSQHYPPTGQHKCERLIQYIQKKEVSGMYAGTSVQLNSKKKKKIVLKNYKYSEMNATRLCQKVTWYAHTCIQCTFFSADE